MGTDSLAVTPGSGTNIATHQFTEDAETREMERVAPGFGQYTLPGAPQASEKATTGLAAGSGVSCVAKGRIILKTSFSASTNYARIRVVFYDSAASLIGYSDEILVKNTGIAESARYSGDLVVLSNDAAATTFDVYVTEISAGNISIHMGAV